MATDKKRNITPMVSGNKVVGRIKRTAVARPKKLGKGGGGVGGSKRATK